MNGKLRMSLDDLRVETFHTLPETRAEAGTVQAHASGFDGDTCFGPSCRNCPGTGGVSGVPTCAATCPQTCVNTCDDATCAYTCDDPSCGVSYCGGGCGTTVEPSGNDSCDPPCIH